MMGKKQTDKPNTWYDFFTPGTDVLRNSLGIENPQELENAERTLSQARLAAGADIIPRTFDFEHLKTIHLNLFQDVYPDWAGEVRPVGISKGVNFTEPYHIEAYAEETFRKLAEKDFLQGLPRNEFVTEATELLGHLNAIHPFREGNGRAQREFIRQLADEAGDYSARMDRMTSHWSHGIFQLFREIGHSRCRYIRRCLFLPVRF